MAEAIAAPPVKVSRFKRVASSWAVKSLAIGGVGTMLDLATGSTLLFVVKTPTQVATMSGVAVGALFNFFANRRFAFGEQKPELWGPLLRFILGTAVTSTIHGFLVKWLWETVGVPFVPAKLTGDLLVLAGGQLLLLRYFVFPKKKGDVDSRGDDDGRGHS